MKCASVWQNAEVVRITLLYCQKFGWMLIEGYFLHRCFLGVLQCTRMIFEPTCAHARWALMCRLASICLSRPQGCYWLLGLSKTSHGSRSKFTLVKPSLKVMILAGGLTSTSSYIFIPLDWMTAFKCWNDSKTGIIVSKLIGATEKFHFTYNS